MRADNCEEAPVPPHFERGNLPRPETFRLFRKTQLTQAVRISGPFRVRTREGWLDCPDGWLALDSGGWPYPIDAEEFQRIYEAAP